jgi:hypothetical protein
MNYNQQRQQSSNRESGREYEDNDNNFEKLREKKEQIMKRSSEI